MSGKRSSNKPAQESVAEVIALLAGVVVVLFTLVWFLASHRIVWFFAEPFRWMAAPYMVLDPSRWQALSEAAQFYQQRPRDVGLILWIRYINACVLPTAVALTLAMAAYCVLRFFSKGGQHFKRKLDPLTLAKELAGSFPNILPVLHLGPDLIADKLPLWRRQMFPEEIWQQERVDGRPLASHGRLDVDAVRTWLRGGEKLDGPHQKRGDRRWSRSLGYQVVDLMKDVGKQQSICFPDRFSAQGKVLFGLLAAHAFGGREGKTDYEKACAQISRTCAGQANGLPNLKVAQWIYSKYRMNSSARELFAVHHWEYTYLYALFMLAKKNGKATHTDWIWLKPVDRALWYALNTVGRATPHAESAAVFAMVDYEVKCAKANRLPLRVRKDGEIEHHIHVLPSVEAFDTEFTRWSQGVNDDDDWWRKADTWRGAQALAQQAQEIKAAIAQQSMAQALLQQAGPPQETEFDRAMSASATQQEAQRARQGMEMLRAAFAQSSPPGSAMPDSAPSSKTGKAAGSGGATNPLDDLL